MVFRSAGAFLPGLTSNSNSYDIASAHSASFKVPSIIGVDAKALNAIKGITMILINLINLFSVLFLGMHFRL